jgi:hypothetical protein
MWIPPRVGTPGKSRDGPRNHSKGTAELPRPSIFRDENEGKWSPEARPAS